MKPIEFEGMNAVFGKNQPEYRPLPAEVRGKSREVVTCWELSPEELKKVQETGRIWVSILTFGHPYQPTLLDVEKPAPFDENE